MRALQAGRVMVVIRNLSPVYRKKIHLHTMYLPMYCEVCVISLPNTLGPESVRACMQLVISEHIKGVGGQLLPMPLVRAGVLVASYLMQLCSMVEEVVNGLKVEALFHLGVGARQEVHHTHTTHQYILP